jgi:hypothetical protein
VYDKRFSTLAAQAFGHSELRRITLGKSRFSVPIAHDEDALYLRRGYSERQRPAVFLQVL